MLAMVKADHLLEFLGLLCLLVLCPWLGCPCPWTVLMSVEIHKIFVVPSGPDTSTVGMLKVMS